MNGAYQASKWGLEDMSEALAQEVAGRKGNDPQVLAKELLRIVDAPEPPLRVLLGRPIDDIRAAYEARLKLWEEWAVPRAG